jgi:hypothetical protein
VFQLAQVAKLPVYIGELFLQAAPHRCAWLQAIPSELQEPADFTQLESQALHATNEGKSFYIVFRISPEASFRPRRPRQLAIAFVEANRVHAKPNLFRDDANLHNLRSSSKPTP